MSTKKQKSVLVVGCSASNYPVGLASALAGLGGEVIKQPKPANDLVLSMKYEPPHEFPFIPDKPKEYWRGGRPR